jgi:diguanylate cyclase (GGDEF)-like protein
LSKLTNIHTAKSLSITNQFTADIFLLNTVEEVLACLVKNIVEKFGFANAEIYTLDAGGISLSSFAVINNKVSGVSHSVIPLNKGLVGQVAATKKALLIRDTREFDQYIETGGDHLSALAVPILVQEQLLAVVSSGHARTDYYTQAHLETLYELTFITSIKISQIRQIDVLNETIEHLEYSNKIQDALFDIAELTYTTNSTSEFYRHLHQCIKRLTFTKNFFVAFLKNDGKKIEFPYAVDEFDQDRIDENNQGGIFRSIELDPRKLSITAYALLKNEPVLLYEKDIRQMLADKVFHIIGSIPTVWLGVPFGEADKKGIVVVQSYSVDFLFQEKDKQLLSFVAKHIHNAIERMDAQQALQFLALYDGLTRLPNRSLFNDKIQNTYLLCQKGRSSNSAILFLDVDRFKQVNDTYGHHIGDKLLVAIAKSIKGALRETDTLARLGGDEFAILLEGNITHDTILRITESIIGVMKVPFKIDGLNISSSVSIGISTYDNDCDSAESLLIDADHAMYQAKLRGRNQYVFFNALENPHKSINVKLEYNFDNAIKNNQFIGFYQPLIDLETGSIAGVEVLVRWLHPKLGMLFPDVFIPILEKSGQIVQLDIYMLKLAVDNLTRWFDWLPETFKLNVNISTLGFSSEVFISFLQEQYSLSSDITSRLCIEITEASLISNVEAVKKHLAILKDINIPVALDDFGAGYSSLNYLHQFAFDILKIDKSFIEDLNKSNNKLLILNAIVNLAKSLKIKTTAEGIETIEQLQKIKELGCDLGQGYYIAKPLSDTDFEHFYHNYERDVLGLTDNLK